MSKIANPQVGQRLRQIREHRGISQGLLARLIDVSIGTIQNYEHGRVRITADRLEQLAQALQCQVIDLLMPPGSSLPKYRFSRQKDVRNDGPGDPLDHLAAIWEEMRVELRIAIGIDIGDGPARDWIAAIRERMGLAESLSQQAAQERHNRIRGRLLAYHALKLK